MSPRSRRRDAVADVPPHDVTSLLPALGVTRVARITGLDRAGVEVACAVRPGGHVLQVTNGKGLAWERARASAVGEAAELWAAERPHGLVADPPGERWELRSGRLAQARCAWVAA